MRPFRALAALLLAAATPAVASAQCPPAQSATSLPFLGASDPMVASSEWAGLAFDAFTLDGDTFTTVQDGGRISTWNLSSGQPPSIANVPKEVRDTIRRVHFLPDATNGWAVGQNGYILRSTNGGQDWSVIFRMPPGPGTTEPAEDLWDIHFLDTQVGFLAGLRGVWFTIDGGGTWTTACLLDRNGDPILDADIIERDIEFYSLDVVQRSGGSLIGFLSAEPGLVFRTTDGSVWHEVFDILDLCNTPGSLPTCAQNICPGIDKFEPWGVEISRNPNLEKRLALVVGGVGNGCGLVFASGDDGASWVQEFHECTCTGTNCRNCTGDPLYDPSSPTTFRRSAFGTLYDVAILDDDNSAVAGGYGGQHVVRYDGSQPPQVWKDRSSATQHIFSMPPASYVTIPLLGAAADGGNSTTGNAMLVGPGGYVRYSSNGGETWTSVDGDGGFRIRDVWFMDTGAPGQEKGWVVGQNRRIAVTTDGGKFWSHQNPSPSGGLATLLAVSFRDPDHGVTVGRAPPTVAGGGPPEILWTDIGGAFPGWKFPSNIVILPNAVTDDQELREVDWAGGTEWWSAGDAGLIFRSIDDGDHWSQFVPRPYTVQQFQQMFEFDGVSFRDTDTGLFVGFDPTVSSGGDRAVAYQYHRNVGSPASWDSKLSAGHGIERLTAVDISGDVAYAVGWRFGAGGLREGVILVATASGGLFGTFAPVPNHPSIPACEIGGDLNRVGVLEEVEILPNGDVVTAGECGRGWRFSTASGTWTELKTHTDSHVQGISAANSNATFFACHRRTDTNSSIVRVE